MKGNENTIKREFSAFKSIDDNTILVTDVSDKVRVVDKKDKYMTLTIVWTNKDHQNRIIIIYKHWYLILHHHRYRSNLITYIVSNIPSKKVEKIDMVTSLKGNE